MYKQQFTAFNAVYLGPSKRVELTDHFSKISTRDLGDMKCELTFEFTESGRKITTAGFDIVNGERYMIVLSYDGIYTILNEEKNEDPRLWSQEKTFLKLLNSEKKIMLNRGE
jgi:hypothetical protein